MARGARPNRTALAGLLLLPALCLPACVSVTLPDFSTVPGCEGNVETIRTESLPDGVVGQPYSFRFEHNCSGTLNLLVGTSWRVSGGLPPGITLGGPGLTNLDRLSGTPTVPGTFPFVVSLSVSFNINGSMVVESKTFSLVVRPAP